MSQDENKAITYQAPSMPGSSAGPTATEWGRTVSGQVTRLARRRWMRLSFAAFLLVAAYLYWATTSFGAHKPPVPHPKSDSLSLQHLDFNEAESTTSRGKVNEANIHFLMVATDRNVDLCKTLLATGVLGYPSPTILAWEENLQTTGLGGGSHLMKISKTLKYLNSLHKDQDDDLVFMIDAYDIHFQLPVEVLLERYHRINARANARLQRELGPAYEKEDIRQRVIFGAGKSCWPNALWELACYTVPQSLAPHDLYNNNTDTVLGRNTEWSMRQRYINSGFIIGPVKQMRKIFERTQRKADDHKKKPIYGASDQGLFAQVMGEQNYAREMARLKHVSEWDKFWHPKTAQKPRDNMVQGLYIDNILQPSTFHNHFELDNTTEYELGIGVDYYSELGHQTMKSDIDVDSQWLVWDHAKKDTFEAQVKAKAKRKPNLDCPIRVPEELPYDIADLPSPFHLLADSKLPDKEKWVKKKWSQVPLYAHLCMGTVPIMIHHNGGKHNREKTWPNVWMQPKAKTLLQVAKEKRGPAWDESDWDDFKRRPRVKRAGGAWTDKGQWIEWGDMCPDANYAEELYR